MPFGMGDIQINGRRTVPHILNLTVQGVDAEPLMAAMLEIGAVDWKRV
jgi:hypothetical protein